MKEYFGLFPKDKAALLVFYCQGLKCGLSHKAALWLKSGATPMSTSMRKATGLESRQRPGLRRS